MILTNLPAESTHWYEKDGTPAYTIIGANGKERPVNLRDAKKLGLIPSVTTVLKVAANPGLDKWKRDNLLMAAATLPHLDGESADQWIERVYLDSQKQSQAAAQLGTDIHTALEQYYLGSDYNPDFKPHVQATVKAVAETFGDQDWRTEKSFATDAGYAGKTDLCSETVMIDFKTTAFDENKKDVGGYDEHLMQISAYGNAVCSYGYRGANVYVSTTVPGLVRIKEWTPAELLKGYRMFLSLLDYWKVKNGV